MPDHTNTGDQPASDLDAIRTATTDLITNIRQTVTQVQEHEHPPAGGDLYCLNLTSYLGSRMPAVLRRLDAEVAEVNRVRTQIDRYRHSRQLLRTDLNDQANRIASLTNENDDLRQNLATTRQTATEAADHAECMEAERDQARAEIKQLRDQLAAIYALHTDSPASVCPTCYRAHDVSDTDDGLVDWPCPTLRAMGIEDNTGLVPTAAGLGSPGFRAQGVLAEVAAERAAQDERWGEQNHPDGTGGQTSLEEAVYARERCQAAAAAGKLTWRHILREEYAEALAEHEPDRLRVELLQVAAVAVAWIQALDRRVGVPHDWREPTGEPGTWRWAHCDVCGTVRRHDGQNGGCRGPARVELRTEQSGPAVGDGHTSSPFPMVEVDPAEIAEDLEAFARDSARLREQEG